MKEQRYYHRNSDICDAIKRLPGGVLTTDDMENNQREPWGKPDHAINAHPDRMKLCPLCDQFFPITDYLEADPSPVRIITLPNGAFICANVRQWCSACHVYSQAAEYVETTVVVGEEN